MGRRKRAFSVVFLIRIPNIPDRFADGDTFLARAVYHSAKHQPAPNATMLRVAFALAFVAAALSAKLKFEESGTSCELSSDGNTLDTTW